MVELTDTHCHIHEAQALPVDDYTNSVWLKAGRSDPEGIIIEAANQGVNRLICVGTSLADSERAVDFVQKRANLWASIGVHPHEAKDYVSTTNKLQKIRNLLEKPKVVAIGECGLDYHYNHSNPPDQQQLLRFHLDLAQEHDLPVIFHIREAFDDFWPIFDEYKGLKGVIHSFSSTKADLEQILTRGLYVGLNGIMTFTKEKQHHEAAKLVPLTKLLLETDAPYLTPAPYRGTICEPKHVGVTAEFLSQLRGEALSEVAAVTTANAKELFKLDER